MGDFAAADLRRPDGLYPQHANSRCAGCDVRPDDEERSYADALLIWHTSCWPSLRFAARVEDPADPGGEPVAASRGIALPVVALTEEES